MKTLPNLLKARKALDAKIAALRTNNTNARLVKGAVVEVKKDVQDTKGNWVENREIDCHYNEYGYVKFTVVAVKGDKVTLTDGDEKFTIKKTDVRKVLKKA